MSPDDQYSEAMNVPVHLRSRDIAWQVETTLAADLMNDLGWFRVVEQKKDDDGAITGIEVKWLEYGHHQLVSSYGANKIYMHLKVFLSKELPLTNWNEMIIKNTILNHINSLVVDLALDSNMGVKDEDLDTVNELLKTIFREQAYKAREGYFMDKLGEEKRILVTERRDREKTGFWPWNKKDQQGGMGGEF